ncbi:hypothetical protein T11_16371 [Trichinella zimbabwensis]|uniref:Uncharacterized protein n=1 Tax=Trichinella zimbabwensis TaxID=268475 RepID=A0A0V1HX14_9BILA|nr:hypothetical protein T11_16371 [Trichinella zimbabwensis]
MPASSRITKFDIMFSISTYRVSYVPLGKSGNNNPVPASTSRAAALFIKARKISPYVQMSLPVHKQYTVGISCKNMDGKKLLIPFWYNLQLPSMLQQKRFPRLHSSKSISNDHILVISWMSGKAFGPLAVDCIPNSLKNVNWPNVDGSAEAAAASSS